MTLRDARKILVIGCGGAGKSTFARALGAATGLPVVHLDRLYWRAGWIETPKPEWARTVAALLDEPAWIMDGNYSGTLEPRARAADAIVWLDLPRTVCLAGVMRRRLRGGVREDMTPGCAEHLSWDFVQWIWRYPRKTAPKVETLCNVARDRGALVLRLRSRRAVAGALASLTRSSTA